MIGGLAVLLGGHRVLDLVADVLEPLDRVEVAVHDLVEQEVEQVADPLGRQPRRRR